MKKHSLIALAIFVLITVGCPGMPVSSGTSRERNIDNGTSVKSGGKSKTEPKAGVKAEAEAKSEIKSKKSMAEEFKTDKATLITIKDIKNLGLWKTDGGVKIDTGCKKGIKVTIPADKDNVSITLDTEKMKKVSWDRYQLLKIGIHNLSKEAIPARLIVVRKRIDGDTPIPKEHPRFNKAHVIKPGENILKMDVSGASSGWVIGACGVELVFNNKGKDERNILISHFLVGEEEEE